MPRGILTGNSHNKTIATLYIVEGWSIRRIADYFNMGYATVHRKLKEEGVERRTRGGFAPGTKRD